MDTASTSVSLLWRLKRPDESAAWERFIGLYAPMIHAWVKRQGLADTDADDLAQEVMTILVQKLPEFDYSPDRSFRGWLRTITVNKTRDFFRRRAARKESVEISLKFSAAEPVVEPEHREFIEAAEYRAQLVGRALRIMQAEFRPATWQACWRLVVDDCPADQVAAELGITANAVYIAKSRVLRRLREELHGLLD